MRKSLRQFSACSEVHRNLCYYPCRRAAAAPKIPPTFQRVAEVKRKFIPISSCGGKPLKERWPRCCLQNGSDHVAGHRRKRKLDWVLQLGGEVFRDLQRESVSVCWPPTSVSFAWIIDRLCTQEKTSDPQLATRCWLASDAPWIPRDNCWAIAFFCPSISSFILSSLLFCPHTTDFSAFRFSLALTTFWWGFHVALHIFNETKMRKIIIPHFIVFWCYLYWSCSSPGCFYLFFSLFFFLPLFLSGCRNLTYRDHDCSSSLTSVPSSPDSALPPP